MKFILFIFLILAIILFIITIIQKEPLELSFSIKDCFGNSICWIGQTVTLGINFNTEDTKLKGIEKPITIRSVDGKKITQNVTLGNQSEIKIPISATLNEGDYKFEISSEFVDTKKRFLLLKRWFGKEKYISIQNIKLQYPIVKVEEVGYKCLDNGFYFEEIKLKLEDPYVKELDCKLRIYVDKLVITNHNLLMKKEYNGQFDYYDKNYSKINKLDLMGSVQKINFLAGPAVQQTNTKVFPVCLIDGNDVEIKNQGKELKRCDVNK